MAVSTGHQLMASPLIAGTQRGVHRRRWTQKFRSPVSCSKEQTKAREGRKRPARRTGESLFCDDILQHPASEQSHEPDHGRTVPGV